MPSHIRTFVYWKDATIFAGEELECVITFKNISRTAAQRERDRIEAREGTRPDSSRPVFERQRTATQSTALTKQTFGRALSVTSRTTAQVESSQHPAPSHGGGSYAPSAGTSRLDSNGTTPPRPLHSHGRSLSILSLGGDQSPPSTRAGGKSSAKRITHNRSASLQILSRGPAPTSITTRAQQPYITLDGAAVPQESGSRYTSRDPGVKTVPTTPDLSQGEADTPGKGSPSFRFPVPEPTSRKEGSHGRQSPGRQSSFGSKGRQGSLLQSPSAPGDTPGLHPHSYNVVNKVLSEASIDGTPRTSSDVYGASDSDDTVASELPAILTKFLPRPSMSRQSSQHKVRIDEAEHLMMGYVQCMGSFSLDGSLVNQAPFEDVKRRGVLGSQGGGGVVGVEQSKRSSGLFGGFGWGNIGESLTGLLGKDDMSSMKEMNRIAETRNVPLLSTPQSILFVDLRLGPGESRSYTYRFKVPQGLPPSYRGRAIKIAYHLRLAVQRSGSVESQNVKDVEVPFRVLGSVNRSGEILGHDLMSPYTILQDTSKTAPVPDTTTIQEALASLEIPSTAAPAKKGMDDFLRYTERLINEQAPNAPLMSPTAQSERRFSTDVAPPMTQRESIDYAILRSNQAGRMVNGLPAQSSNKFTISRGGHYLGVLAILRPAYRLGETVLVNLDFRRPPTAHGDDAAPLKWPQQAFVVSISLETAEKVDPSLALRSAASITRVTRKVHASATGTVLFADQASFGLEIPLNACPTFETTGLTLGWRLRVEFTTSMLQATRQVKVDDSEAVDADVLEEGGEGKDEEEGEDARLAATAAARLSADDDDGAAEESLSPDGGERWVTAAGLLAKLSADDRGDVLVARERLAAETFEVGVPIRVYGVKGAAGSGGRGVFSDVLEI